MRLIIKSPAGILFDRSELGDIQLALSDGKMGVRPNHAPLISEIGEGEVVFESGEDFEKISVHSGIAVVENNVVTIYTTSLDQEQPNIKLNESDVDTEFDDLYEEIIALLIPDTTNVENVNGA